MKISSNPHIHTNFCDGENTPEEMVKAAIRIGFTALGFTGHSPTPYDLTVFRIKIYLYILK